MPRPRPYTVNSSLYYSNNDNDSSEKKTPDDTCQVERTNESAFRGNNIPCYTRPAKKKVLKTFKIE